jgi:hypothetical protein
MRVERTTSLAKPVASTKGAWGEEFFQGAGQLSRAEPLQIYWNWVKTFERKNPWRKNLSNSQ